MHAPTHTRAFALCLLGIAFVTAAGCSSFNTPSTTTTTGSGMMGRNAPSAGTTGGGQSSGQSGGMMGGTGSGATSYSSDGQRIYLTGVGTDGQRIPRTAPAVSQGSLMMGGGGCGSCHAANGRGGTIRMMAGTAIKAPDITYPALIGAGFTDATIANAIRNGTDEKGEPLKEAMPRWQMSEADLAATISYLKVLGSQ